MNEAMKTLLTLGFDRIEAADMDLNNLVYMLGMALDGLRAQDGQRSPIDRDRVEGVLRLTTDLIDGVRAGLGDACEAIQAAMARAVEAAGSGA